MKILRSYRVRALLYSAELIAVVVATAVLQFLATDETRIEHG